MPRRLAVRLPLLVALALGAWLWQSNLFPQPRELALLLPAGRAPLSGVELQLYAESGELLKREEWSIPARGEVPSTLRVQLPLRPGRYLCRVFLKEASGAEQPLATVLEVGDLQRYELELRPPRPPP